MCACVYRMNVFAFLMCVIDNSHLFSPQQKKAANVVALVLTHVNLKDTDIDSVVGKLSEAQLDLLMKYIYRVLETGEFNSVPVFKWHKAVRDKAGIGSIVRALVERKTVICDTKK